MKANVVFGLLVLGTLVHVLLRIDGHARRAVDSSDLRELTGVIRVEGDSIPPVQVERLSGPAAGSRSALGSILPSGRCDVIYFFASSCIACENGAPEWTGRGTVGDAGRSAPVIWVAVNSPPDSAVAFTARHGITADLFSVTSRADMPGLGVPATPLAWVVHEGQIVHLALGLRRANPAALREAVSNCMK